jgi:hypothetical protein
MSLGHTSYGRMSRARVGHKLATSGTPPPGAAGSRRCAPPPKGGGWVAARSARRLGVGGGEPGVVVIGSRETGGTG